jgi:hypothetical protein
MDVEGEKYQIITTLDRREKKNESGDVGQKVLNEPRDFFCYEGTGRDKQGKGWTGGGFLGGISLKAEERKAKR